MNFAYKLMCAKFDGVDFREWLSKLEQYFEAEAVPELARVRLVMLHLEGKVLQWHQFLVKSHGDLNQMKWNDYLTLMRERFAPGGFDDPFADLVGLNQTESVEQYYDDFIHLLNQVNLPEDYVLSLFKSHLRIEISQYLKLLQPKTLLDAFHMAKNLEAIFFPVSRKHVGNTVKSTQPTTISIPLRSAGNNFRGSSSFTSNPGSKPLSPNALSPTAGKSAGSSISKSPGKLLTASEIDDRRKKCLCFWCSAKYAPGHQCAKSQMFQIMVEGAEEEVEPEEFLDCEEGEFSSHEGQKGEVPTLSLQAMWGESSCETMKFNVQIGGEYLVALVDSGSSHTFISPSAVKRVGLLIDRKCCLKVTVANGGTLETLGWCKAVKWETQGKEFETDFLILPLKNSDLVLGVQWLSVLGPIKWDFATLKMEFQR
ncbi:hypothetical protein GQ457_17G003950 [Hibiscus cannabinus]